MHALIKSTLPRFRRAGIEFSAAGVELDLAALSASQVEAIYAEPRLQVSLLEVPDKGAQLGQEQPSAERSTQAPVSSGEPDTAPATDVAAVSAPAAAAPVPAAKKPAKGKAAK